MSTTRDLEKKHPKWVDGVAGGMGGVLSKTLLCPLQRVIVLKQLGESPHLTSWGLAQKVMAEGDGLKAFWRGNLTSVLQRFPYSGSQLIVYDFVKHFFQDLAGLNDGAAEDTMFAKFIMKAGAGGTAAVVSGSMVYPMEVIRTRIMSGDKRYRTIFGTTKQIWAETNSPKHFYKGLTTSLMQRVPDILINFAVYESIKFRMEADGFSKPLCIMAGSSAAALTAIAFTFPLDVCKRRIAMAGQGMDKTVYKGFIHCATTMLKKDGPTVFYRGAGLESVRCVPQVALMWFTIEYFRTVLTKVA
jgi:hypothetical protein